MALNSNNLYGFPQPLSQVFPAPIIAQRAPTTADISYPIGQGWIDEVGDDAYVLVDVTAGTATWVVTAASSGSLDTLTADSGGVITPSGGNIDILGTANQITTTGTANTITFTLPAAITAPGSITATTTVASTTTMTAGTGFTATTGNIVASTGNITSTLGSVSAATTVTAGTGLTVTTGNLAVSAGNALVTGNVIASKSDAGANVTVQATNSDNTNGASNGGVEIAVGGASGGDPYLSFQVSGVAASTMTMGLDNSASDLFVISNSASIGTSNALTLTQAGALDATTSITAGTTLTATLGAITATNGNLAMGTAGNKIIVPTGANASAGTSGVMAGTPGAVTVATTACSGTALIFFCRNVTGGTPGDVSITAQDGTGFTLTSTGNETSTFNWWIINA